MTKILLIADDKDRLETVLDQLRELDIENIRLGMIPQPPGIERGLAGVFGFQASPDRQNAPPTREDALKEYEKRKEGLQGHDDRIPFPQVTIDGTRWKKAVYSEVRAARIVSLFNGTDNGAFAHWDVEENGERIVRLYTSPQLAHSDMERRVSENTPWMMLRKKD